MNAAIRAVVRSGICAGLQVFGVRNGFAGLLSAEFVPLGLRDVGGLIDRGGTFLGTSRCEEIREPGGQALAVAKLRSAEIDGLIVIGGNGSQAGAHALHHRHGFPVIGIASTIDNDLAGTDISLGATTALDTAVQAIDRLRVTASSHRRAFLVEVMGRNCGYLALVAGIASGAESIVIPEAEVEAAAVANELLMAERRGKKHAIVVVAEGARQGVDVIARHLSQASKDLGYEVRVTRLGHVQRGGVPCVFDRMIATELGAAAVEQFAQGNPGVLIGFVAGRVQVSALAIALETKPLDLRLLQLANVMAR
jgi:6-phosphofructokinase 1